MSVQLPPEAVALVHDRPVGHLATVRPDGRLSVTPVSLLVEGGRICVSTTKDRAKYRNLMADDRVAISVPARSDPNVYVEVRGRAVVTDDGDRAFVDRIAQQYLEVDTYPSTSRRGSGSS